MIGFERVGHLVALASDNLKPEIYDSLCVTSESLEVSFDAYVKSQVHLNLTDDLFSRPLRRYVHAMRFLERELLSRGCFLCSSVVLQRYG